MRRQVLYSGSRRTPVASSDEPAAEARASAPEPPRDSPPSPDSRLARLRALAARHLALLFFVGGVVCAALVGGAWLWSQPKPRPLVQEDIDAAVLHTLQTKTLPSRAAKAAEVVRASVVRVRGFAEPPLVEKPLADANPPNGERGEGGNGSPKGKSTPDGLTERSVGSGVVVVDEGLILTNLHVVAGTKRVSVTFHDGTESEASVVSIHPENDLAVIKAHKIPDDLPAATLGSADMLKPGDEVVAVGFPMGIGPSVSAGVVSGLNREFHSPEGDQVLTRLIQFDAAVNPGSSGGPLVTMQGDVVGIVTAILSPNESRTFIGIGFAVTIAAAGGAVGMHPF